MANKKHLAILEQGVEAWNKWRREKPDVRPNLKEADLRALNLSDANFSDGNLSGADLSDAVLIGARLSDADLTNADLIGAKLTSAGFDGADLYDANLSGANLNDASLNGAALTNADLTGAELRNADLTDAVLINAKLINADLTDADLTDADFRNADLSRADLGGAFLIDANFSGALLQDAEFINAGIDNSIFVNNDLSRTKGLDSVRHDGPSIISIDTLYKSGGNIPEAFLRGCGLKDWEIESAKLYRQNLSPSQAIDIAYRLVELRTNPAIQFNSCFISYSSLNQNFSEGLYADLQDKGVRCWFAPENMKIGDRIRKRIDEAIRLQDRLLLVLSETSIESQWVEQEVESALEKERSEKRTVLCPIRLDEAVMKTGAGWASLIKNTRHIGDFSRWEDHDEYQKAFNRLLRDLKAEA